MIAAVEKIFPSYKNEERMADQKAASIESIRYLLNGLWVSGLRLGEALALTWDQWADGIRIEVDGPDVFLLIDSEDQKNRETELHPVTPDFSDFLLSTPPMDRHGFVFNPKRARKVSRRVDTVSDWIVDVGEKAGVKVDQKDGKPVYASAHDLRRAFGDRWSRIVEPARTAGPDEACQCCHDGAVLPGETRQKNSHLTAEAAGRFQRDT